MAPPRSGKESALSVRVGMASPFSDSRATTPYSPYTPQGRHVHASVAFQRALQLQWLHPAQLYGREVGGEPLAQKMKAFRKVQTSARQEELRSELVFSALQHEPGSRSSEHVATIQSYVLACPDVLFAPSMPPQLLRHVCAGAETAMVEDGKALFASGEPVTAMHIVLSGQLTLRQTKSGEVQQARSVGIGRAVDYEDFIGTHGGVRRTTCYADGTVMVLKLVKQVYERAVAAYADEEIFERVAAIAGCEVFSTISHKLRLQIAEMLRAATFRHGSRIVARGTAADRLWLLRSGNCKVVTTLRRPAHAREVKIQNWGTASTCKQVDVIRLQTGDVLGVESILNSKFRPSPAMHAHHALAAATDAIIGTTRTGLVGGAIAPESGEDEGIAAASPAPGGPPSAGDQVVEGDAEKRYRATAVKYSHTVVADGEVAVYELAVGDLWKIMRGASDSMRETFEAKHRAALARRESLHSAQVAEICAVQPVVWPDHKARPATASSLLVRSNAGFGRAGGPGQGGAAVRPRPATAGPLRRRAAPLDAKMTEASPDLPTGTAAPQDSRHPPTEHGATASSRQESQRLHRQGQSASASTHTGGTAETGQGLGNNKQTRAWAEAGPLPTTSPKQQAASSRPSTARASWVRGSNWDQALGGSDREVVAALEATSGGTNGRRPDTASDCRTLEEFMRPTPANKKKTFNKNKLSLAQQEAQARRAAAHRAAQQPKKNRLLGRRKKWAYVETMKSRREKAQSNGTEGGAKAERDAIQSVAFWPHCRFDKKAFILDMPSSSNPAKG